MKPEEIRNLNWGKVEDWSEITATHEAPEGMLISNMDINAFVENVFRDVARKLNMSTRKIFPILRDENNAFFQIKCNIFEKYEGIGSETKEFLELKKLLRVPDIYFSDKNKTTVDTLIDEFNKLSNEDKEKFTKVLIPKIESDSKIDSQKVIEYFDDLPDIEKFNVMKYLGLYDIRIERISK